MNEKTIKGNLVTLGHIHDVRKLLYGMIAELGKRAQLHDQSKLESPEAEIFGEWTPKLKEVEYGSDEYTEMLEKIKPAIEHHYAKNRHHPEHWPNGVNDMTLIDLLEMLCDWRASSSRDKNGNLRKSVETSAERFGFSDQLKQIFENTVREHFRETE